RNRQHAFGDIAVELDIGAGQKKVAAHQARLRFDGEGPKASAWQRLLSGPAQHVAQRLAVGCERALDLERGLLAHMAIEGELERRTRESHLQSRAIANERGKQVAGIRAGIENL